MLPNAFIGLRHAPTDEDLSHALGHAMKLWSQLLSELAQRAPTHEWSSYSSKAGWSLKVKNKDRTILYLIPRKGSFDVSLVLGDRAIKAAKASKLPQSVLKRIAEAKKFAEGTGVRLEVTSDTDLRTICQLADIKLTH